MSEFDSAFLCGLLKKFRPQKIVEIGIATGVTTAIILQCLEDIGQKYYMRSIDISEPFHLNPQLKTGFWAVQYKSNVLDSATMKGDHDFYIGTTLPYVIDEIGDDIDFVMLDTAHSLPGEVLDFLTILPHLKKDAIICLHDVSISHIQVYNANQYATTALFSSVVADKYLNFILDNQLMLRYPNIAAFQITDDTVKTIENIFLSLIIRWSYIPEGKDLIGYTNAILKNYSQDLFLIFQEAVRLNFRSISIESQTKSAQK